MIRTLVLLIALFNLPARAEVEVQDITTPGGISAWLVENHDIPFTALEIRFRSGANMDPPGKRGAANLMMALLEEGAGEMDSRAFSAARDSLAAQYEFDAGNDAVSISARFLTENRDQAVDLLRLALIDPRFDQDAVDRVRGQVLSIIRSDQQDPNHIANRAFDEAGYTDHPYARDLNGTIATVTALTRDDMFDIKDRVMTRDRLYVSAVGDITAEELSALLDHLLGDLPATGPDRPKPQDFTPEGEIQVIPFDTPQSVVLFGHHGIPRDDPDFLTAYVMNNILGGSGFNNRLIRELRQKRGLTYSAGSFLVPRDLGSMYLGQFASSNATVAEAIEIVRTEWTRMHQEGVTQEELDSAITYLTGAYPLRFDGNARIAGILVGMQMQGMGIDYIANRNDLVRAITVEDINRVARRILDPENLYFTVVGQPEGM